MVFNLDFSGNASTEQSGMLLSFESQTLEYPAIPPLPFVKTILRTFRASCSHLLLLWKGITPDFPSVESVGWRIALPGAWAVKATASKGCKFPRQFAADTRARAKVTPASSPSELFPIQRADPGPPTGLRSTQQFSTTITACDPSSGNARVDWRALRRSVTPRLPSASLAAIQRRQAPSNARRQTERQKTCGLPPVSRAENASPHHLHGAVALIASSREARLTCFARARGETVALAKRDRTGQIGTLVPECPAITGWEQRDRTGHTSYRRVPCPAFLSRWSWKP
jgi:hypothetical protein